MTVVVDGRLLDEARRFVGTRGGPDACGRPRASGGRWPPPARQVSPGILANSEAVAGSDPHRTLPSPVLAFLADLSASGCSRGTLEAYELDLRELCEWVWKDPRSSRRRACGRCRSQGPGWAFGGHQGREGRADPQVLLSWRSLSLCAFCAPGAPKAYVRWCKSMYAKVAGRRVLTASGVAPGKAEADWQGRGHRFESGRGLHPTPP